MLRTIKWTGVALVLLFAVAQLSRPARTNPAIDRSRSLEAHTQVSPEVAALLERACNDCHSNETEWPWYSKVAPVSWFVVDHVNHGRKHLNFSDWSHYDRRQAQEMLEAICDWVRKDRMPLDSYTVIHRDAHLSNEDKKMLCEWASGERARLTKPGVN